MKPYTELTKEELIAIKSELETEFEDVKGKGLNLNMSRGKPAAAQLDMAEGLLGIISKNEDAFSEDGTDCRNYGVLTGLPEARKLMADICEVSPEQVIVYGNASLTIMFDTISRSFVHGVAGCTPWCKLDHVKFLCPVPGYDRHFGVTEYFGVEMVNVPMTEEGPDMDLVEKLVAEDDSIKGIWCVPKYSNPQGYTYSDETVRRFARLKPAAKDFRIFWDNAYIIHHLYDEEERQDHLLNIIDECEKAGNPDLVYEFVSTSKVSFPGAGIAALISSKANLEEAKQYMNYQIIGHDKLNQLRHVKYYKNLDGIKAQMSKHASVMRPKFETVLQVLEQELGGLGIGSWSKPNGGYFISFDAMEGCAKKIVAKAKEAGLTMTGAGATFPYHKDPKDSNIRIAPSFPTPEELSVAGKIFVLSVKLVSIDKILENME
ncbi:MAG: aminotransferase [Fusicatenibacter sp.]|nr:aminotransferase [Lachnospiraceae bacterium]MDY2937181.1 aminotransferase [Fusicatenibacter sp.]